MRYYDIQLYRPGETAIAKRQDGTLYQWTSHPKIGSQLAPDPGALHVILDSYVYSYDAAEQQTILQIWGPNFQDLMQASNFTGWTVKIYGGFQSGLPLNNPAQAGLLIVGTVFQCFGNWQGTDMTLDFVIVLAGALASQDTNISFFWAAGTSLQSAVSTCLKAAFPDANVTFNISPKLVLPNDEHHVCSSLTNLAQYLRPLTQQIVGGSNYPGVMIVQSGQDITVTDNTTAPKAGSIAFQDFVGQPTWIANQTIQFANPMRADLTVGGVVTLPTGLVGGMGTPYGSPGAVVTTSASQPQARQSSSFSGQFTIVSVHHLGAYRQPDGQSWITVINATVNASQSPSSGSGSGPGSDLPAVAQTSLT